MKAFHDGAHRLRVRIVLILWACADAVLMLGLGRRQGGAGVAAAGLMIAVALLTFLYYYRMSRKQFGGTTGDLAGYFLQVCELAMLAAVIIGWNL